METKNNDLNITAEEHKEFLQENTFQGRMKILLKHSEKNNLRIERSRIMEQQLKSQEQIQREMMELGDQFSEFLHAKGIIAKFKLAFANMGESAREQREQDKLQIQKVKAEAKERHEEATAGNKDFVEFLHTKGFKAKCRLVIENMKKGASESRQKTAESIAKATAQAQGNMVGSSIKLAPTEVNAEILTREFNAFLKSKGLDGEYTVVVENK